MQAFVMMRPDGEIIENMEPTKPLILVFAVNWDLGGRRGWSLIFFSILQVFYSHV